MRQIMPFAGKEFTEGIGLCKCPREPVKYKPFALEHGVGKLLVNQPDHNFIGHKFACIHNGGDTFAHGAARTARGAQHVAR